LPVIAVLAVLAGCGAQRPQAEASRPAETTNAPVAECTSDGVAFSLGGADAAMGVRVVNIQIANCGDRPVTVNGYPRLRLFGEDQEELAVTVAHGSTAVATVPELDVPAVPVVLAPGESAWAGLVWRNLVTDSTVRATDASGLDVALGPDTDWQHVPMTVPDERRGSVAITIDLGNTDKIGVGPWQASTDAPAEPHEEGRGADA
jgi:uncharacterized protein DUF4232